MNKKIITYIILFLCLFMLPAASVSASETIGNNAKGIPDRGLYQEILKKLGKKPKQKFTKQEAEQIKSLSTSSKIKNLKGIKYLKNLKKLDLESGGLKNLKGIESLTNLDR